MKTGDEHHSCPWAEYKGQEPTVQHDRYRDTGNIWKHRSENRMFEERDVMC